jgi:7,8-dihydropterin-6-yl-methyl-4-(beta-D-ribofuranosyl)aminobenzene 5'-phosphate synthase
MRKRAHVAGVIAGLVALAVSGCVQQAETVVPAQPVRAPTPTDTPAPTTIPSATPAPIFTPAPVPTEVGGPVTFSIVYDNNGYDVTLKASWGFSCLVETGEVTMLFDTGGDGPTLLSNMAQMGIDPQAIDAVALSHIHGDHTGGLMGLLDTGARPTVYVPAAFPASFKEQVRARTELVEVAEAVELLPEIYTTGEMGSAIVEQALAVETADGLVVVTGCAHPGVVEMVRRARKVAGGEVVLVMGGFHLGGASRGEVESIIADLRQLGVQRVAPCHCTGDRARGMFADAFGADFVSAGVGRVIVVGTGR